MDKERKRVLLVAFHFPPIQGSSGLFRSIGFSRYLPPLGWDVSVLTVPAHAYLDSDDRNLALIPEGVRVIRAFALNAQKHLAVRRKFPGFLALPDAWQSWVIGGVARGLFEIYTKDVEAIISTYPIATAHLIGFLLRRLTGKPWIADFRDPMVQGEYPKQASVKSVYQFIERAAFAHAQRVLVVSEGTKEFYRNKYPAFSADRIHVIENGYDEAAFRDIEPADRDASAGVLRILHSGVMYPRERNPESLFHALARLKSHGSSAKAVFVFRAAGSEDKYRNLAHKLQIEDLVSFEPALDYRAALSEMLAADALLVCQGAVCDGQIPAKLYEYIFSGRTIIGLCTPDGDTGRVLRSIDCPYIAPLEDSEAIEECLGRVFNDFAAQSNWTPDPAETARFTRKRSSEMLLKILNELG